MTEFATYFELGFRHIVGPEALDHILFLVALAALYRLRDVREVVWVVTAFTVGHSVTLALAVMKVVILPQPLIEFLIPATIVLAGLENIVAQMRGSGVHALRYRPLVAAAFGLVHGAGFANYLASMFVESIAVPLLGFNVGIEVGQLTVLAAIALALAVLDRLLALARRPASRWEVHPVRVVAVSLLVVAFGLHITMQRLPW